MIDSIDSIDSIDDADRLLADAAVTLPARSSGGGRIAGLGRAVSATPGRAAAATAGGFALAVAVAAAATHATVTVTSGAVRERVSCGLDVYLYGHPDHAVASACRHAEGARLALFVPAALVVIAALAGAAALAMASARRHSDRGWVALLDALPLPAIVLPVGLLGVVAGLLALRPAETRLISGNQLVTARCGIDTYLFGHPDAAVEHACRHAYTGHAWVLLFSSIVVLVVAGLVVRHIPLLVPGWSAPRLAAGAAAVVLAVVAAIALAPTQVVVTEAGAPVTARCGLDSYIAGYPDHAVESRCRHKYTRHALVGVAASADAVACGLAARALRRRRSPEEADLGSEAPA